MLFRPSKVDFVDNPEARKIDSYPLFDWLRFILASVVALVHANVISWAPAGNLAVQVFFALSGFLIGGILLKSTPSDLPRFFFNRSTRIWPPYFFAIAALYILSTAKDPVNLRWLEFLFYDATFTHNWFSLKPDVATAIAEMPLHGTGNHFWSIGVEEQFYLAAPLVVVIMTWGRNALLWAAIAVFLLALQLTDFASISLGVAAAMIPSRAHHLGRLATAGILAGIAIISFAALITVSYNLAAPLFAVAVVCLCARPGLRRQVGVFAGAISFPMYLNHWMGVFAINAIAKHFYLGPPLAIGLLSYLGGVLSGAACYLMVDRNVMAHRNDLYTPTLGIGIAAVAYLLFSVGLIVGAAHWW